MKLAIMTKPTFFVEEDKILSALCEVGMDGLHLYKPFTELLYSERLLSLTSTTLHSKIILHQHFALVNEYKLGGIHLSNPNTPSPKSLKGFITRSCNNLLLLKEIKKKANFVLLHNICNSISCPDESATFSYKQLELAAKAGLIDKHVFALGGMSIDNIKIVRDLGFGGVVVSGDLWNKFSICSERDFKPIIQHFEQLRKASG